MILNKKKDEITILLNIQLYIKILNLEFIKKLENPSKLDVSIKFGDFKLYL